MKDMKYKVPNSALLSISFGLHCYIPHFHSGMSLIKSLSMQKLQVIKVPSAMLFDDAW